MNRPPFCGDHNKTQKKLTYKTDCLLPTTNGDFRLHLFLESLENGSMKEHLALVMGEVKSKVSVLIRIHSECCTGDIFGCQRCDCQDQLQEALNMIRRRGEGVLLYLRQEGRGIGLENKLRAYQLQDEGLDTVEANIALGFEADQRNYDIAAEIINHLEILSVEVISNNLNKVNQLLDSDIKVSKRIPLVINSLIRDRTSLFKTKMKSLGHVFDLLNDVSMIEEQEDFAPLTSPHLFIKSVPLSNKAKENILTLLPVLKERLQKNLICVLMQGEGMRGELSSFEEKYDYICILNSINKDTINQFAEIKRVYSDSNILFLSDKGYKLYPKDSRLQFFITRKVYGEYCLGKLLTRKEILDTAIRYALVLKDKIRPLILSAVAKINRSDMDKAREILRLGDDCFLRVVYLYVSGKYPLHRSHLREQIDAQSVSFILDILENWNQKNLKYKEVLNGLHTLDRLINIFLTKVYKFNL